MRNGYSGARLELNRIYQMDCLEGMVLLPDASIDLILCDLPYGTTACAWDDIIPLDALWRQYKRLLKPEGVIVLTASQPFTSKLVMSNPSMFREEIIWLKNKAGSGFQASQKHLKVHETILVFAKSGKYTFNPQQWLVDKKEFMTQRKTFGERVVGNNIYGKIIAARRHEDDKRNPVSIVSIRVPFNPANSKEYSEEVDLRIHPTQKPLELFKYLIKTFSNPGDVVLDNAMGSGTTAVACQQLGRKFIGFEKELKYVQIAEKRLQQKTLGVLEV